MKTLFVQLSDMHCTRNDRDNRIKIQKAVDALYSLGKIDSAILIFTGDLTNSAKNEEFNVGKQLIGTFLSKLGKALNCGKIETIIVPGNHDIDLSNDNDRTAREIEKWNLDDHINDEIDRLNSFYVYAATKHCFKEDKLCDVKIISTNNLKIQVCLLNSAPFSTKCPDDKQFHYIPQKYREKLSRNPDADLKITLMHHHYEWCEWDTKEMIKKSISSDDLSFFGHDHKSEQVNSFFANGKEHRIIMGGEFSINLEKNCSFNALIYDDENDNFESFVFNWEKENELFTKHQNSDIKKRPLGVIPSDDFLKIVSRDNQGISKNFLDYYVFPKLAAEGEFFSSNIDNKTITDSIVFDALKRSRMIRITGNEGSGKTSLLRYLYIKSIDLGFSPLLIDKGHYSENRFEKMIFNLLEDQYQIDSKVALDVFEQIDRTKIIFFIDDADLIRNAKSQDYLFSTILEKGYSLIFTTREKDQNLEQIVKNKLQGKEITTLCIPLMYKESRDQLIDNVGIILGKDDATIDNIKTAFDYMVQSQVNLFTFTPLNTLQYVKYFFQRDSDEKSSSQTLSLVFESNIRNSILQESKNESMGTLYLSVLEFLADKMYFDLQKESIDVGTFSNILNDFNQKRKTAIHEKRFLDTCKSANIYGPKDDSLDICFYDNNTFAYFVARAINREFEKDSLKTKKLEYVMNHICFGINDTIILFLSFIRSNTNIILNLAKKAVELMSDYPEWDFDNNLSFIRDNSKLNVSLPHLNEAKDNTQEVEKIEKSRHDSIQYRNIFDYTEEDVQTQKFVILRAFKYMQIVSRALVDQYGTLETDEINTLLETIFSIPQKVIYSILLPYQEKNNEIVASILSFAKEKIPNEKIDESKVRKLLANSATVLALNIMNDIAFNSSNSLTISVLKEGPEYNSNHIIMKLMMAENAGNSNDFINYAIDLQKEFEKNYYAKSLIAQIARKHILYHQNINYKLIDKLISANIFSEKSRSYLLIERGSKDD